MLLSPKKHNTQVYFQGKHPIAVKFFDLCTFLQIQAYVTLCYTETAISIVLYYTIINAVLV